MSLPWTRSCRRAETAASLFLSLSFLAITTATAVTAQTTYVVDNWDDSGDISLGDGICDAGSFGCTFRAAVEQASAISNPLSGPFTVEVPPDPAGTGQHPLVFDLGTIYLNRAITIRGTGPSPTIIEFNAVATSAYAILSDTGFGGSSPDEIVIENLDFRLRGRTTGVLASGSNVTIRDTIFRPADGGQGPGIEVGMTSGAVTTCERCQFLGGGSPGIIANGPTSAGKLFVIDSVFRDIEVIETTQGGAMQLTGGSTHILRSEFSGNSVDTTTSSSRRGPTGSGLGGAIFIDGNGTGALLTMVNSTLDGNTAAQRGGGIYAEQSHVNLANVTITENHAGDYAGGGGIYAGNLGVVQPKNSMIALNTSQPCAGTLCLVEGWECGGLGIESLGYNLIFRNNACNINQLGGNTDATGILPKLLPLTDLGGYARVRPLESDSFGVDDGNPAGCFADDDLEGGTSEVELIEDQRGALRPEDGDLSGTAQCDIGAYEYDCAAREASCQANPSIFADGFEAGNTTAWQ